jgi:hypothetical protein
MYDTSLKESLIDIKGDHLNLIHINLDNSESSTKESNLSPQYSKCFDDSIKQKFTKINIKQKNYKEGFLNKKVKREKLNEKSLKTNNLKIKKSKYQIILNLFKEFKSCSKLYREYIQFHYIEKNIKNFLYTSPAQLALDIRNIFSHIFATCNDPDKYNKTLVFCELFENTYKKYENKKLTRKCKILSDIINKLKRELRHTELSRIFQLEKKTSVTKNKSYFNLLSSSRSKFLFRLNETDKSALSEKSVKKFKKEITNKINKLNKEQKRGIFDIISNNCIDKNMENSVMEIDINKMSFSQLKELEKYLNKCIKDNNLITFSHFEISNSKLLENENDILKNDDISSCLSDYEDEDDE